MLRHDEMKLINGHGNNGIKKDYSYDAKKSPVDVEVVLDCEAGTVSYVVDGHKLGVAFTGLSGRTLRLIISSGFSSRIEILSYEAHGAVAPALPPPAPPAPSAALVTGGDEWDLAASSPDARAKCPSTTVHQGDMSVRPIVGKRLVRSGVHTWRLRCKDNGGGNHCFFYGVASDRLSDVSDPAWVSKEAWMLRHDEMKLINAPW